MMSDLISRNGKAEYIEVMPRFEEFENRNDDCDQCPFYDEECSGDGDKRCFSADILELLKRGHDLEMDAEPVRHSKWVEDPNRRNHWHCRECKDVWGIVSRVMNYCPKCGAKMDEEV